MIKVNELRVGNWVKESIFEIPFKLSKVDKEIEEQGFLPIPLTPEILEKARFNKVDNEKDEVYYWYSKKLSLTEFKKRFKLAHYDNPVYIKYLHQLQNLYFALTGEELEVNL